MTTVALSYDEALVAVEPLVDAYYRALDERESIVPRPPSAWRSAVLAMNTRRLDRLGAALTRIREQTGCWHR